MVLTEAQLQEIAKRVRAIIRAESKGVGDLPVATSLDGLLSLPALRFNGGVPEVVEAPISKLQTCWLLLRLHWRLSLPR